MYIKEMYADRQASTNGPPHQSRSLESLTLTWGCTHLPAPPKHKPALTCGCTHPPAPPKQAYTRSSMGVHPPTRPPTHHPPNCPPNCPPTKPPPSPLTPPPPPPALTCQVGVVISAGEDGEQPEREQRPHILCPAALQPGVPGSHARVVARDHHPAHTLERLCGGGSRWGRGRGKGKGGRSGGRWGKGA